MNIALHACWLSIAGMLQVANAMAADAAPTPRDLYEAQCVAALELQSETLAQQVKSGNESQRAPLLDRLIAGTAFVGDAYLHSKLTQAQARQLTHEAAQAQKDLGPAELTARQDACAAAGAKMYAAANGLQKKLVQQLANKRMDKLLGS